MKRAVMKERGGAARHKGKSAPGPFADPLEMHTIRSCCQSESGPLISGLLDRQAATYIYVMPHVYLAQA